MFKNAVRHIIGNAIEDLKIYQKIDPSKITLSKSMHSRLAEELGQPGGLIVKYLGIDVEIDHESKTKIRVD